MARGRSMDGVTPPATPGGSLLFSPRTRARDTSNTPRNQSTERDAYFSEEDQMRLRDRDSHYWAQQTPTEEGVEEAGVDDGASDATRASDEGLLGTAPAVTSATQLASSSSSPSIVSPSDHTAIMASLGSNLPPSALYATTPTSSTRKGPAPPHSPTRPASQLEDPLTSELKALYKSLHTCMMLRDKYMGISLQAKLEDNPKNWDAEYCQQWRKQRGLPADTKDIAGEENIKVDGSALCDVDDPESAPKPWRVYPAPPRPHWELFNPPPASSFVVRSHSGGTATLPRPIPPASPANAAAAQRLLEDTGGQPGVFDPSKVDVPGEWKCKALAADERISYETDSNGVYQVHVIGQDFKRPLDPDLCIPTLRDYFKDLDYLLGVISDGPVKSFAWRRLKYLEGKWNLYFLMNEGREVESMKRVRHRDFYNVRKVDTHVHHSASMNQKHLLRFIKAKIKRYPDDVVIFRDGRKLTLAEVFASLNLTAYDLSIDTLDMHAHREAFHRFDKFNTKYNPIGESRLREIFLKTDNLIQGRYLAEITKEIMSDLQSSKYQMAEYRVSIYGRNVEEWDKLATWIVENELFSPNVRWLIQIPRLYEVYRSNGTIGSFQDLLNNVFEPLFACTLNPSKHRNLHIFLQRVIGFDLVDDESKVERRYHRKFPTPSKWDMKESPSYSYWIYYMYANIASLNQIRRRRGFGTFVLRPHSGEAGDTDHLAAAYLCSQSISHGITLRKVPAMQYLYYLKQVGLAMSPLSNNALFLHYDRNPFPTYLKMGMNVSISTDDPLQLHLSKEPLLEEYSVATQVYRLSPCDMCELARNSVLQSGWEREIKRHWLGVNFHMGGPQGNVTAKTNVPDIRLRYRHETLSEELDLIGRYGGTSEVLNEAIQGSAGNVSKIPAAVEDATDVAPSRSRTRETSSSANGTSMRMVDTAGLMTPYTSAGISSSSSSSSCDATQDPLRMSSLTSTSLSRNDSVLDPRDYSGVADLARKMEERKARELR